MTWRELGADGWVGVRVEPVDSTRTPTHPSAPSCRHVITATPQPDHHPLPTDQGELGGCNRGVNYIRASSLELLTPLLAEKNQISTAGSLYWTRDDCATGELTA